MSRLRPVGGAQTLPLAQEEQKKEPAGCSAAEQAPKPAAEVQPSGMEVSQPELMSLSSASTPGLVAHTAKNIV